MKKLLAGGTLAVLALGGMVATAAPASAHTPNVSADCGVVNVDLQAYRGADVTVVIDGETTEHTSFRSDFVKQYELSLDAPHEWSVNVEALDNGRYDYEQSGSLEACEVPSVEVAYPATPETVAGCAASLDDVILPPSTEAVTYTKTEAGIVAALTSDDYVFPEDLGNYVPQEDGSALLPTEYVVIEEECADSTPEPTTPVTEPEAGPSTAPSEAGAADPVAEPTASPSPSAEAPPVLAATGATVGGAIAFAALLAAGGVVLVWARKRMQKA